MILMIVEDEKATREGLAKCLDWDEVGISKVFCAENGEEGLSLARRAKPDIVLTDIRMPRMDGIAMAGRIRDFLPECRIIFLSAYSEIDYYKAAIDLKVVRYLDKPVEPQQLRAVMLECVAECAQREQYQTTLGQRHLQDRRDLADAICLDSDGAQIKKELRRLGFHPEPKGGFYVLSVLISLPQQHLEEDQENTLALAEQLSEAAGCPNLYTVRHKNRIVLHFFTPTELSGYRQETVFSKLKDTLGNRFYTIVTGRPVRGAGSAAKSYSSAKDMLSKAYCSPWREVVLFDEALLKTAPVSAYGEVRGRILETVRENRQQEALEACGELYQMLRERKDLEFQKAKELYIELASEVFRRAEAQHLRIKEDDGVGDVSWIARIENHNLDGLHDFLCLQIALLFDAQQNARNEKRQILAIKDYIARHYADDSLSISDIGEFMHMSASHLCTMFKRETGDTINNWLTEFRLEKAKQYLRESPLSVAEISEKVGYNDNSYFGRLFRKRFDMTPNEYRNGYIHA